MPVAIVVNPLGQLSSIKPTKYEMAEIYLGKYLTNSVINYIEQGKYFYSFTTHSVNFKCTQWTLQFTMTIQYEVEYFPWATITEQ